jgi:hypothetical protein
MHWTKKDIKNDDVQLVQFFDGRLFSILRDRNKREPTYSLGDEFGLIEENPQHQGPYSEECLLSVLTSQGAMPVSVSDAQRIRADHRVRVKQRTPN